jgi:hypothetical protein
MAKSGRVSALLPERGRYAGALVVCRLSEFSELAGAVDFLKVLKAKKEPPEPDKT